MLKGHSRTWVQHLHKHATHDQRECSSIFLNCNIWVSGKNVVICTWEFLKYLWGSQSFSPAVKNLFWSKNSFRFRLLRHFSALTFYWLSWMSNKGQTTTKKSIFKAVYIYKTRIETATNWSLQSSQKEIFCPRVKKAYQQKLKDGPKRTCSWKPDKEWRF